MTNQVQGEIIFQGIDSTNGKLYTPWMPARGTKATFALEMVHDDGVEVKWNVETRTREDPSSTPELFSAARTVSSVTVDAALCDNDAKELVRYAIWTNPGTVDVTKSGMIRFLQPSWQSDGQ